MKKLLLAAAGIALLAVSPLEAEEKKTQKKCPIMGGSINKSLYADVQGKRIYVCCKGCINPIKANPQKYIKKLTKAGVKLDKAPHSHNHSGHNHHGHDHSGHNH